MRKLNIGIVFVLLAVIIPVIALAASPAPIITATTSDQTRQVVEISQNEVDILVASFYCDVRSVITGSIGTLVGLMVSLVGGYNYLMTRSGYGLFFFIAGVAFTALPSIFNWYYTGVVSAFGTTPGTTTSVLGAGQDPATKSTLEDWCTGGGYVESAVITAASAGTTVKLRDRQAEAGVGLDSLSSGTSLDQSNYCHRPIDAAGAPLTTLLCNK